MKSSWHMAQHIQIMPARIAGALSGVGHSTKWSPRMVSFGFHGSPIVFTSFYRWGSRHPERVSDLPWVTQLRRGSERQAQVCVSPDQSSQPLYPWRLHSRCSINGEAALISSVHTVALPPTPSPTCRLWASPSLRPRAELEAIWGLVRRNHLWLWPWPST